MNEQYIEDSYPISPLQQGMLFHSLYAPQSGIYIPQMIWTLYEDLNVSAFKQAWEQVVKRHPILRTSFHWEGLEEPLQKVHQQVNLPLIQEDWRGLSAQEQESRLETYLHNDRRHDFELTKSPLMRLALFQISETDYQFIWTYHHALFDGLSRLLIVKEIFAYYEAFCQGYDLKLKQPRPYRAHIEWLQQQNLSKAKAFWQQKLKGFSAPTSLIQDQVTDSMLAREKVDISEQEITLSKAETSALKSLAQQHGLTLNTVLQGTWVLLLSRYSGSEDVVFGATRACRHSTVKEAKDIVGLFINVLPIRVQVSPEMLLIPWLKKLRAQWIAMREYEQTSHLKIQEWSDIPPGTPLFESTHDFRYSSVESTLREQGGNWKRRKFRILHQPNVPLSFQGFGETELLLKIQYNRGRLENRTIARRLEHIKILLESLVTNPEQRLSDVRMLTEPERKQILVDWNDTSSGYPRNICIHRLFEEQVEQSSNAVAVVYGDEQLTYRELNARANQLARYLNKLGVGPEVLVGICLDRSVEMVVAILGILKAGGAYVPLDQEYPPERLAFILSDIQAPVLLTQQSLMGRLPEQAERIICLDTDWATIEQEDGTEPTADTNARNLAYIIYTSGSTGKPKGVMIPHAAICNHMLWMQKEFAFEQSERVLQKTPFTFDASVWEFYAPLISGGQLVMAKPEGHRDSTYLVNAIIDNNITTLQVVPSQLKMLLNEKRLENCLTLRRVFCGGEALTVELSNQFMARLPSVELINLYGPSEATIDTTFWRCHQQHDRPIMPIGLPIGNMQVYILDPYLNPVPVGVQGELHIAGPGIGRGYLNRPDLTAEKFVSNPFRSSISTRGGPRNGEDKIGGRLYKSGDIARYWNDGTIEFLGRKDFQVKLRGFRIELGEIEAVLGQHPEVQGSVALVREDEPGDKRLVAYVVASHEPTPTFSELRSFLKEKLPDYMIPSAFVFLNSLPLTPNGKVDRRALPTPDGVRPELDTAYQVPRGGVEQTLAQIWKQILRIDQVGRQDNFFELGGDSILSIQIVAKAHQSGLRVTPRHLFQYQTIAELAEVVEALEPVTAEQGAVTGPLPLSPIQHWFFGQQLEEPNHWNMAWVLEAKQPVDPRRWSRWWKRYCDIMMPSDYALFPSALAGSKN